MAKPPCIVDNGQHTYAVPPNLPAPEKRHSTPHSAVQALQESCAAADTLKPRISTPEGQPAIAHGSQKAPIRASITKILQTRSEDAAEISSPKVAKSVAQLHESDNTRSRSPSAHDQNSSRADPSQRPVGKHCPLPPQQHKVQRGSSFDEIDSNVGPYQWAKANQRVVLSPTRPKRRGVGNPGAVRDGAGLERMTKSLPPSTMLAHADGTGLERMTKSLPPSTVLAHAQPVCILANSDQDLSVPDRARRSSWRESTTEPAA